MSMQSEGKNAKGRNYDQVTRDGTSSAGSMGVGGTGDIGAMPDQGSQQSASRSDDLLAGDTTHQEADQAFGSNANAGQLQTGMEGIGKRSEAAGNRQSGQQASQQSGQPAARQGGMEQQGSGATPTSGTDPDQYDQGTAAPER